MVFIFYFNEPFLIELHFKAVAHQLNNLGESYVDVLHHQGPLSAAMFRFFYGTLGDNVMNARLFALFLCLIQVMTLTIGINGVNGLKEFNAFTGVIHVVLLHLFADMIILTPLVVGMTFICFAYVFVLNIIRGSMENHSFLLIGLAISIAGGFLFPLFIFTIPTLIIIIIYTRFDSRSIGLYLVGLSIPLGSIIVYYYSKNFAHEYLNINLYYGFSVRFLSQLPLVDYLAVAFIPAVLFIMSFFKIFTMYHMVNYQQKMIVSAIFYLISGVVILLLLPDKSIYYYALFVPFLIHFFGILFIENQYKRYISKLIFVTFCLILSIPFINNLPYVDILLDYSALKPKKVIESYGKVLNLSEDKNILANNKYGTGFCDFVIAKGYFTDTTAESSITIFEKFEAEMPDVIYDPNNLVAPKFEKIPQLARKYQYMPSAKIYKKL
jgi:hypothetical protein